MILAECSASCDSDVEEETYESIEYSDSDHRPEIDRIAGGVACSRKIYAEDDWYYEEEYNA